MIIQNQKVYKGVFKKDKRVFFVWFLELFLCLRSCASVFSYDYLSRQQQCSISDIVSDLWVKFWTFLLYLGPYLQGGIWSFWEREREISAFVVEMWFVCRYYFFLDPVHLCFFLKVSEQAMAIFYFRYCVWTWFQVLDISVISEPYLQGAIWSFSGEGQLKMWFVCTLFCTDRKLLIELSYNLFICLSTCYTRYIRLCQPTLFSLLNLYDTE